MILGCFWHIYLIQLSIVSPTGHKILVYSLCWVVLDTEFF